MATATVVPVPSVENDYQTLRNLLFNNNEVTVNPGEILESPPDTNDKPIKINQNLSSRAIDFINKKKRQLENEVKRLKVKNSISSSTLFDEILNDKIKRSEKQNCSKMLGFTFRKLSLTELTNFGFEFHLLLPEDTSLLPERLESFACWCQGFMKGLDMADLSVDDIDNEDILEAIGHIDDFSDMDAADFDYEEDDEKAYFEITEYVRLSVLHIFCDLNETEGGRPEPVHH